MVPRLGRDVAVRIHRAIHTGDNFTDRNQLTRVDAAWFFILPCSSDAHHDNDEWNNRFFWLEWEQRWIIDNGMHIGCDNHNSDDHDNTGASEKPDR